MARAQRWAGGGMCAVLVVAVGLALAPSVIPWNDARPWLSRFLSAQLGRQVVLGGDLDVGWRRPTYLDGRPRNGFPVLHIEARQLTVANTDWASAMPFASLAALDFDVSVWPLLAHRVEIPVLRLTQPVLDLERGVDGRDNWGFSVAHSDSPNNWSLTLGEIAFPSGRIAYQDAPAATHLQFEVSPLGQAVPFSDTLAQMRHGDRGASSAGAAPLSIASGVAVDPYALSLSVRGTFHGKPLAAQAKVGSVLALNDARRPFPLQADLHFDTTHITLAGTLLDPAHLAALDVRLGISGVSSANLYQLTGINLPASPAYATDGRLVGTLQPGAVSLSYQNFNGRVGSSDLHGSLLYQQRTPRPLLSGTLDSNLLQLADLGPLIGADSNASKANRGIAYRQPAERVLPGEPFTTERWQTLDLDVNFTGRKIVRTDDLPLDNLVTHVVMNAGVLSLEPLRFGVAGGTVESTARLDGSKSPLQAQLKLAVRHLKLKQLFPGFAIKQSSFGEMNGDTALSATGNSLAALAGAANGELKLVVSDGTISATLLEEAGLNVGNVVFDKLFGNKDVKVNCAASDFVATNGMLDARFFALDTEDALITTTGNIDLKSEQMNLTVRPQTKGLRILSLRSPLYVKGTFKQPDVGVDKLALALRGGAVLGLGLLVPPAAILPLLSPSHDQTLPCAKLVSQMRSIPLAPPPGQRESHQAPLDLGASSLAVPHKAAH